MFAGSTSLYLLDCVFDPVLSDYPSEYDVYLLLASVESRLEDPSWADLSSLGRLVGRLPTERVKFDETRRRGLDVSVVREVQGPDDVVG